MPQTAQASTNGPTSKSVLTATKASVANQRGVHVVHSSKSGSVVTTVVADIGKTLGVERITSGTYIVTITVTASYVYLSGNAGGLVHLMGLTAAQQKMIGTKAMSMKKGTTPYTSLALSATTALVSKVLPAAKGTVVTVKGAAGSKYYQLKWTNKATSSSPQRERRHDDRGRKATLPIKETITASTGSATTTFTKWGELISAVAPPASTVVTYNQVFG